MTMQARSHKPNACDGRLFVGEEAKRIRLVFGLPADAPLPNVEVETLVEYYAYLNAHLTFPFAALYAETKPPIRQLVHYITVMGLAELEKQPLEGVFCRIAGLEPTRELSLVEIGVRDDSPNYQTVDDYAFWFLNCR
jgi:hypothetical protein